MTSEIATELKKYLRHVIIGPDDVLAEVRNFALDLLLKIEIMESKGAKDEAEKPMGMI